MLKQACAVLFLAACSSLPALDVSSATEGEVLVSSSAGVRTIRPTSCESGALRNLYGADFRDGDHVVRLILPPEGGARVRIFDRSSPLEAGVVFDRASCSQFELSFGRTGWRVNDVDEYRAGLAFDCRNAGGETARGTLKSEHCR